MQVAVRPMTMADTSTVGEVHVRAWQAAYRGVMPDEYLDALRPEDRADMWRRGIEAKWPGRRDVIAVDADVAGFAAYGAERESDDPRRAELYAINVHPDYWRRGLGRRLIGHATAELSRLGFAMACCGSRRAMIVRGVSSRSRVGSSTAPNGPTPCRVPSSMRSVTPGTSPIDLRPDPLSKPAFGDDVSDLGWWGRTLLGVGQPRELMLTRSRPAGCFNWAPRPLRGPWRRTRLPGVSARRAGPGPALRRHSWRSRSHRPRFPRRRSPGLRRLRTRSRTARGRTRTPPGSVTVTR